MKSTARRLSSLLLAVTITVSLVVAALAPLFISTSIAQTNPQTTDIFTGQFIPAYFGAAYDPSEAFKQMAGLPVYVFAYDTWGSIVNNFAYKTQIKADGSFQAGGLPNASHYGVCFATSDASLEYFRAPLAEDGIQSAFAYNQATLSENKNINTQITNQPVNFSNLNGGQGCRVFLTSSRNVDIANHINIFPIVPTSVLSVIISDPIEGAFDFYNQNKPYEIYAQRVVINNAPQAERDGAYNTGSECIIDPVCQQTQNELLSAYNSVAVGPVIRGRTIPYNPVNNDGSPAGAGTIFQAFAPRGIYAITYWRPDSRSSNAKMTYLTYDGLSSLDTPYNGIAIEEVEYPTPGNWGVLSTRSAKIDDGQTWKGSYGSINAWGMATRGKNGQVIPQRGIDLSVNDSKIGFINIFQRKCEAADDQDHTEHETSEDGLYILSSACDPENPGNSSPVQTGDISTSIRAYNSSSSDDPNLTFSEQSGLNLQVTGRRGPARRDIPLNNIPEAYSGLLQREGKPFAYAKVDLLVDGRRHTNIAQADSTGFFYIPTTYFNDNPYTKYEVQVSPSYYVPNFGDKFENTFALDNSQVLAAKNSNGADMGVIAVNSRKPSQIKSFLAGLSLDKFFEVLRFPTAYAQQKIGSFPEGEDVGKLEMRTDEPWKFEIDLEALGTARKYFNPTNYHLKTVEINPPDEGLGGTTPGVRSAEYEYFTRNKVGEDVLDGAWLEGVAAEKSSLLIKGVQLKYEDGSTYQLGQRFKDLNTTYLSFKLRVRFEYQNGSSPQRTTDINGQPIQFEEDIIDGQQTSVGQTQGFPNVLEATWPVEIHAITTSGDIQNEDITSYEVRYSPIVLDIETPSCGGGNLVKDGFADVFKNLLCKLVIGGINGVKNVISFMADNFLTVDPLNYSGSEIVIKYWNVIRNLVNSLAVLILLIAGVAIMIQYEPTTYNLQSVLKKLIIAVVLVNFSILIIQLAIDVANVLSQGGYYMLNDLTDSGSTGLANVNAAVGALSASLIAMLVAAVASGFTGFMAMFVFLAAILILLLYVCYKVIVQYFFRMATLWICIILAPAAFAARVLPGTSSYFGKWKNILVGALVAQAALALMLGLSLAMIVGIKSASGGTEAFILVVASFVMLYMATKLPNKAAAMMGSDLAGGLESKAFAGLKSANAAWKASRIARRQRKFLSNERERTLGIDKDKRTENREKYESHLAGTGKGKLRQIIGGRRFAAAQKLQSSAAMTADGYNRNLREFKRVGRVDYLSGVRGSDLDHAEEEARKTADSQYIESRYAQLPHKDEAMRLQQIEKMIYEQADSTAGIFSHGKLTDARKNLSLVDGRYGYNQHHLDANGNLRKDSLGRDIRLGDVSAPNTVYNSGLDEVFKKNRQYLKGDQLVKANSAITDVKAHIGSSSDIADDYKNFFKTFSYDGKSDKDAWVAFYNDTGEDISPDANYADVMGKVYDDFVIRAADKGDTSWGASLRGAQSQAGNGGISERHRIAVDATDPVLSITHPSVAVVGPALLGSEPTLRANPVTPINGRDLKAAQDAIKRIKLAYEEDGRGIAVGTARSSVTSQLYKSAYQTLYNLGYRPRP